MKVKEIKQMIEEELLYNDVNWKIIDGLYQDLENAKQYEENEMILKEVKEYE